MDFSICLKIIQEFGAKVNKDVLLAFPAVTQFRPFRGSTQLFHFANVIDFVFYLIYGAIIVLRLSVMLLSS